jgi:hypothetical protein
VSLMPFRVLVDGDAPGRSRGVDVDEDGNGVLRDGRRYQLVREHDAVRGRTVEITMISSSRGVSGAGGETDPAAAPSRSRSAISTTRMTNRPPM